MWDMVVSVNFCDLFVWNSASWLRISHSCFRSYQYRRRLVNVYHGRKMKTYIFIFKDLISWMKIHNLDDKWFNFTNLTYNVSDLNIQHFLHLLSSNNYKIISMISIQLTKKNILPILMFLLEAYACNALGPVARRLVNFN